MNELINTVARLVCGARTIYIVTHYLRLHRAELLHQKKKIKNSLQGH